MAAPSMAISTALLLVLLLPAISAVRLNPNPNNNGNDFIRTNCDATLYSDVYYATLIARTNEVQGSPAKLASVAVEVSLSSARNISAYISNLARNPNSNKVLKDCVSNFGNAIDQMQRSSTEIQPASTPFQISNVQTWMSAALTNQDTCADELIESVKSDVQDRVLNGKKLMSIALAFINKFAQATNAKGSLSPPVLDRPDSQFL
ncbi:pectinesterase inhibitor 10-like [Telopea speciosissima]|uniref:pectinesterase inhibitor 10-like n=1 Tax=Telopea speciosissima TaxID=54955 RepID=UPI001CC71E0B|nr:pectinesterase inhibitor 10-like [Telopea speciosissima]